MSSVHGNYVFSDTGPQEICELLAVLKQLSVLALDIHYAVFEDELLMRLELGPLLHESRDINLLLATLASASLNFNLSGSNIEH